MTVDGREARLLRRLAGQLEVEGMHEAARRVEQDADAIAAGLDPVEAARVTVALGRLLNDDDGARENASRR